MTRSTDLEDQIRASYRLIQNYELLLQSSSGPGEQARGSTKISGQWKLIKGYLREYKRLVQAGGLAVPPDLKPIAAACGVALPVPEPDPTAAQKPNPAAQPPTPKLSQTYALIVGVGSYRRLRPLAKTATDARDMYDLLTQRGYDPEHCILLLDDQATKAAINDALDRLSRSVRREDTVLIFFSGHGAQRIGGFEPGEYLCPVETDWYALRTSAISTQEFTTALSAMRVTQTMVFLDACHAGGVAEPHSEGSGLRAGLSDTAYDQIAARGCVVIAACLPDEVSWELAGMRNGLFTHYLLDGMRGAAAGPNGSVRVFDLFRYISENVSKHKPQHPLFKGEISEDFVVISASPH